MSLTFADLAHQVRGHLSQFVVNNSQSGTFVGWQLDGAGAKTGVNLADIVSEITNELVELETGELVHVSTFDPGAGTTVCPPWFRGQQGTPQVDAVPALSRVAVGPAYPTFHILRALVNGANACYPLLHGVQEVALTTAVSARSYALPSDVDGVLAVRVEGLGPQREQVEVRAWRLDTINPDGVRYLRVPVGYPPGRPLLVTYRARPVLPDPSAAGALAATWASTGLPVTACDLPVLYAVSQLVASVDAAKLQMHSMEQGDQNRLIQGGSAGAASRRFYEMFERRRDAERSALADRFPPRLHRENG